jgi:transcriptional regulator with PAS, ATPase and Fis domain
VNPALEAEPGNGEPQRVLHLHHTPRGEEHVAVETTPIRDESGRIAYFVETMRVVRQASSRAAAQGLVGRSPAFVGMLEKILRVANANASVLLLGETGTGKGWLPAPFTKRAPVKKGRLSRSTVPE